MSGRDGPLAWPTGNGEMAERIRVLDWAATPLGPIETWPIVLRSTVELVLAQGFPINVCVGPQRTILYNDAYAQLIGGKHPDTLGRDVRVAFGEVAARFAPALDRALTPRPWCSGTSSIP